MFVITMILAEDMIKDTFEFDGNTEKKQQQKIGTHSELSTTQSSLDSSSSIHRLSRKKCRIALELPAVAMASILFPRFISRCCFLFFSCPIFVWCVCCDIKCVEIVNDCDEKETETWAYGCFAFVCIDCVGAAAGVAADDATLVVFFVSLWDRFCYVVFEPHLLVLHCSYSKCAVCCVCKKEKQEWKKPIEAAPINVSFSRDGMTSYLYHTFYVTIQYYDYCGYYSLHGRLKWEE